MSVWRSRGLRAATFGTACVVALVAVSAAVAAKPDKAPIGPTELDLLPGEACAFPVRLASTGNLKTMTFSDGRSVTTGSSRDTVTNLSPGGGSTTLRSAGSATFVEDGTDLHITLAGRGIVYLFAGDEGPYGTVGPDGALYHVSGRVQEVLDLEQNVITAFQASGTVTELCSLVD
jgi:hypothetical protein